MEKFLDELPERHRARVHEKLRLLAEEGPRLRRPHADHIRGPIRELRIQFGRLQYRMLHYFRGNALIVLVHAFAKKRDEIPAKEIELAEQRRADYEARIARGEVVP